MSYFVRIKKSAEKDFKRLPEQIKKRITNAILGLEENPIPANCKKLINRDEYRIRIGDYRILYLEPVPKPSSEPCVLE